MNLKSIKRTCGVAAAVALLCLSGASVSAGGNYYRWIDETGTTVSSDRPPPTGTDYDVISSTTNTMHSDAGEEEVAAPNDTPAPARNTEVAKSEVRPMLEKNPEYCDQATQNLETLKTRARVRVPDGNGNYRYLNEEEKAEQRVTAEAIVAQHCN